MAEQEVGSLAVGLSMDSANFEQSLASIDRNLKAMGQEMRGVQARGAEWGASTDGLTAKQEGLSRMLESQGTKVERLRAAYEASKEATGESSIATENLNIQLQRAQAEYNRTETELGQVSSALQRQADELRLSQSNWTRLGESMQAAGDRMQAVGDKMTSVGKGLSVGLTAPIVAFGAAGIAAFNDVDEAIDTVITKTGATGDAAEKLTENFRTVAKRVPDDLLSVGESIGEVNTQFGFLGTELEDASQLMLQFASINGTDVTSASIASKQAIEAYGLANSDLNSVLDSVTKTAQDTGQSVDFLFDKATKGAPQIKALGLNFAEGTALIGSFEKAGVDSAAAISSMSKAQIIFAKDGKTLEEGLKGTIKSILGAKSETEALNIAAEVFGTKGGPRMVDAIKRGTFNMDEFTGAGANAAGVVKKTFDETVDPIDQAAIAMNNAKLAMAEVGEVVQVALLPFMEKATEVLGDVADKFRALSPEAKQTAMVVAGVAAAIGPVLVVAGTLVSSIGSIVGAFGTASLAIGSITTGVASTTPAVAALAAGFTALAAPIAIAVGAVAAIAIAYQLLKVDADKALKSQEAIAEQNLELAQSHTEVLDASMKQSDATSELIDSTLEQAKSVDALITSYEGLIEKSALTTEELGQFLTLQSELANTKSPERIAELEERMNGLREKSGLSKEEFDKLLESNIQLTEQFPEAGAVVDEYGNKIADTTGKLREMTAAELERKEIQIYNQMVEDLRAVNSEIDNYESILTDVVSLEKEVASKKKEITGIQNSVNQNETTQKGLQSEILALKEQQKDASIKEWYQLEAQVSELKLQNGQLDQKNKKHNKNLEVLEATLATEEETLAEKQKQRDMIGQLIDKNNANFEAYTKILDAQFDINFEKGKENESIDKAIGKRKEEIKLLQDKIAKEGDSNGKLQEAIKHLQNENGQLDEAKTKLGNINGTLDTQVKKYDEANVELAKVNNKYMEGGKHIDDNAKKTDKLNDKLDKSHTKDVTINTSKDADDENNKWSKPISKVIEFFTKGKSPDAYAKGTNFHSGGDAWIGEQGVELVKMGNQLQLMDFGLYDLPVGAKVFTHDKTMEMLKNNSIASINNATRLMANTSMPNVNQGGQSGTAVNPSPTINQVVNIHSPKHLSPSETARLQKRASQELALGW